jgi:hypothetical protein
MGARGGAAGDVVEAEAEGMGAALLEMWWMRDRLHQINILLIYVEAR